jgi:hypothetical protein
MIKINSNNWVQVNKEGLETKEKDINLRMIR